MAIDLLVDPEFSIPVDVYAHDIHHFWKEGSVREVFIDPVGKGLALAQKLRSMGIKVTIRSK